MTVVFWETCKLINTNLHSSTSCACLKVVYDINIQAVWLYYNLGYYIKEAALLLALSTIFLCF